MCVFFFFSFSFSFCVSCYLLLCLVAKRWVCLVRFDLLLIDGDGGFDCENMNFVGYIDCENVKFDSGFALVLGFGKNMKNKFLCFGFALVVDLVGF